MFNYTYNYIYNYLNNHIYRHIYNYNYLVEGWNKTKTLEYAADFVSVTSPLLRKVGRQSLAS